jgi:putative iron-dependent peroxidase
MVTTQPVLEPLTGAAIFLVVTINSGAEGVVRDLLADLPDLQRSVGFRVSDSRLTCVVSIGATAWDRLFGGPRPAELHPFREVAGARHRAVSTPGDLLFHVRANQFDMCFELVAEIMNRLAGSVTAEDETHGFRYFDERDLLGFVDGTANPEGDDARQAVMVPDEDPDFAGGSYVIIQKYLHDITAWNALSVEEQEKVVGRTKMTDIELPDDAKPKNSHVALNTILDEDGNERQIIRDNMPFGNAGLAEFGTYFIGYASSPSVIEEMLQNMFIGRPPGNYDRILDVSTAVTGSLFFVPTLDFLRDLPGPPTLIPPGESAAPSIPDRPAPSEVLPDGSLGIGDLKRSAAR